MFADNAFYKNTTVLIQPVRGLAGTHRLEELFFPLGIDHLPNSGRCWMESMRLMEGMLIRLMPPPACAALGVCHTRIQHRIHDIYLINILSIWSESKV